MALVLHHSPLISSGSPAIRNNPCPHLHSCLTHLPQVLSQQGRKSKLRDSAGHLWVLNPRCLLPPVPPANTKGAPTTCPEGVHHTLDDMGVPRDGIRQQQPWAHGELGLILKACRSSWGREADERNGQSRVGVRESRSHPGNNLPHNKTPGARRVRHRPCPQVPKKGGREPVW